MLMGMGFCISARSYPGFLDLLSKGARFAGFSIFFLLVFSVFQSFPQTTIVTWNFPDNPGDSIADGGIPDNLGKAIGTRGGVGVPLFNYPGVTTYAAGADHWANGANVKYWQIEFSTVPYSQLTVQSQQKSFSPGNFGPRDWAIQYRIGASGTWTTFATLVLGTDDHYFPLSPAVLPGACNNQPSVYIRWLMTSNTPTQGSGNVTDAAFNYIDDIIFQSACTLPAAAGPIAGPSLVCTGQNGVAYSIPPIAGASWYSWTYSGAGVDINGSSNSVTLNFGSTATSGTLQVYGSNVCGNGFPATLSITVQTMPTVAASPVSQTICPRTSITPINLSNPNNVPGTTYSWTRDNTVILTGIPASGTSNPITGILYSSTPQVHVTTTFTITATANTCSSTTTTSSITVYDDVPPLFLSFPNPVSYCVQDIVQAFWNFAGDITPIRPDWHTFYAGGTTFDLDPSTFNDNCCAPADLILHWEIDLVGGGVITGTGQISHYPSDIIFPMGTNTITYWLEDLSGNVTPVWLPPLYHRPVVQVIVLPRPVITRNF
jgi:hypothetical protein